MGNNKNKNLYALLEAKFIEAGDDPAFVSAEGTTCSYTELHKSVAQMAGALVFHGVGAGDRVLAQVDKSIANVCLYLATLKIGAVYNPLNAGYMPAELDYFIGDAQPALIVVPEAKRAAIEPLAAKHNVPALTTLEADGTGPLVDLAATQPTACETAQRDGDDLAALLYTSGTTGRSKGAMITHENLSSNAVTLHNYWGFAPGDVLLHALPIFHVHGLFVALHTALLNRSKIWWLPKFDIAQVKRLMPESTVMMGVPTFYTRLLGDPEFGKAQSRNIRLFVSGSAPLLAETHVEFEQRTGHRILERYGMTEAGMITSNPYEGGERIAGTVGYALPGVYVRITDPEGTVLGAGEVGVLEAKGPNIFKGYWRNEEKTREEFRDDGYFITGDLSQIADDGRVTIVGRAKDLIISGGFNVYPKEIETEINAFDGVAESAVVGVPHPDFGEGVIAIVVPSSGATLPPEDEIISALAGRLAKFKLPKRVFTAAELPRNAMGKVQKNDLKASYLGLFTK